MVNAKRHKKVKVIAAEQLWSLHWVMSLCFLLLFVGGIYMAALPREVSYRWFFYQFHESMGVLVMLVLGARIFVLLRKHLPLTNHKHRRGQVKTVALHTVLYLFMLAVPLSGYFMLNTGGRDVPFFGIGTLFGFRLPRLVGANEQIVELARNQHFWLAYLFLVFISLHIVIQQKFLSAKWRQALKSIAANK